MLAVYVDESVDKRELQQIVSAAERLGVLVESALNLERRLSLELAQRVLNVEKVDGSGAGAATGCASRACSSDFLPAVARPWRCSSAWSSLTVAIWLVSRTQAPTQRSSQGASRYEAR